LRTKNNYKEGGIGGIQWLCGLSLPTT
jgi:hypothetical protein